MKKISVIVLAASALIASVNLSSCKKDKDNTTLTGTWNGLSVQMKTSIAGKKVSDTTVNLPSGSVWMTLNEDKTFESVEIGGAETGTYYTSGNKLIMNFGSASDADTSIYSISGNTMQLDVAYDDEDGGVVSHVENTLRFVKK